MLCVVVNLYVILNIKISTMLLNGMSTTAFIVKIFQRFRYCVKMPFPTNPIFLHLSGEAASIQPPSSTAPV